MTERIDPDVESTACVPDATMHGLQTSKQQRNRLRPLRRGDLTARG